MIKINLCPIDELESQYWYVPDVATLITVVFIAYTGVWWHLDQIQINLDAVIARTASLDQNRNAMAPDLARFETLDADIAKLNTRLAALKDITVSKISKYRTVIVLEHLQSLKPEGVWYTELKIGHMPEKDPNQAHVPEQVKGQALSSHFEINGQAFNNVLVAELITALRSTGAAEVDETDLRTAVYFDQLELVESLVSPGAAKGFPELSGVHTFKIKGVFLERMAGGPKVDPVVDGPKAAPTSSPQASRTDLKSKPNQATRSDNSKMAVQLKM